MYGVIVRIYRAISAYSGEACNSSQGTRFMRNSKHACIANSSQGNVKFYTHTLCPYAHRVALTLKEKGDVAHLPKLLLPSCGLFEDREVNNRYYSINPRGLVPSLSVDGKVIVESLDICRYVDDTFEGPALMPECIIRVSITKSASFVGPERHDYERSGATTALTTCVHTFASRHMHACSSTIPSHTGCGPLAVRKSHSGIRLRWRLTGGALELVQTQLRSENHALAEQLIARVDSFANSVRRRLPIGHPSVIIGHRCQARFGSR
eukprot:4822940-Pyramimonas_sp.AAC.1